MPVKCKIYKNIPWHTQSDMATFLGRSVKTVNEKLKSFNLIKDENVTLLQTTQTEGKRIVKRVKIFYSFDVMARICLDHGDIRKVEDYKRFLRELGIVFQIDVNGVYNQTTVINNIKKIFNGLLELKFEHKIGKYSVDIFVPKLNLIVEIDHSGHSSKLEMLKDSIRQQKIKSISRKAKFLRVKSENYLSFCNYLLIECFAKSGTLGQIGAGDV